MTQGKHTPWEFSPVQWPEQIGCCPLVGRPYSVHGTDHHNVAAAVSEEIARLIAAAPDMLEALKIAMDYMSFHNGEYDCQDQLDLINAAIARATGEKP